LLIIKQDCLSIKDRPPTNRIQKHTFSAPETLTLIQSPWHMKINEIYTFSSVQWFLEWPKW